MGSIPADPHTIQLPRFTLKGPLTTSPTEIIQTWVRKFNTVLESQNVLELSALFHEDCWWRDMLALTWDFRTIRGLNKVTTYLQDHIPQSQLHNLQIRKGGSFPPSLKKEAEDLEWIQCMFDFATKVGSGTGVLRLVQGDDGEWRAFAISTTLQQLNRHNESTGLARPHGGSNSSAGGVVEGNWSEQRQRQAEFLDSDPTVLIIGAGQSGLNLAARLQQLGLTALIIDKNTRIGDNWRNRYRTLVTHDPIHYCHMAYLPFPPTWPMFTPKDKLADWFHAYASILELNIWTDTHLTHSTYSPLSKTWSVNLLRSDGSTRTFSPHHIVLCTGQAGDAKIPHFPNQASFKGTIYHGSAHVDASETPDVKGKNIIVVGTGNSGHDIAQNFHTHGAHVTMLQRRGTYVLTATTGVFMLHEGMYEENGPAIEDADIVGQSLPIAVQFALHVGLTRRIREAERDVIEGLERAGFEVDFGVGGSGIYRKYITRGGGYYIDVGCSRLIIEGKIKVVRSPEGIKGFMEKGLELADGRVLDADIVVLATGYDNMRTSVSKILGPKVAERCKDVWDLDEEGEVNAIWRDSGHPGFWYMGGSLALARIYSKLLALQIKAVEEGLKPS